jgi:hypothetical protein
LETFLIRMVVEFTSDATQVPAKVTCKDKTHLSTFCTTQKVKNGCIVVDKCMPGAPSGALSSPTSATATLPSIGREACIMPRSARRHLLICKRHKREALIHSPRWHYVNTSWFHASRSRGRLSIKTWMLTLNFLVEVGHQSFIWT